jgi:glyoxylase-like metal-dependent hydrolase (beta-lactamase superfamily II)
MSQHEDILIETLTIGPFMENSFIVADPETRQAIIIDPGDEEERILERVRTLNVKVREIINTHGHIDHAGAIAPLKRALGATFAIHPADRPWLEQLQQQAAMFGLPDIEVPEIDRDLEHGQTVEVGGIHGKVLHTPGHSAGGCSIYFEEPQVVFVGDTLFAGSIGRTDLPGGSMHTLLSSIRQHLLALDDAVTVHCGHGPSTTIGHERRSNPFLHAGVR